MPNRYEKHVLNAIQSLAKANQSLEKRVNKHEQILQSHAEEITELQQQVFDYRNNAIRTDLNAGLTGVEVAQKYNLSTGRISQIRNQ